MVGERGTNYRIEHRVVQRAACIQPGQEMSSRNVQSHSNEEDILGFCEEDTADEDAQTLSSQDDAVPRKPHALGPGGFMIGRPR